MTRSKRRVGGSSRKRRCASPQTILAPSASRPNSPRHREHRGVEVDGDDVRAGPQRAQDADHRAPADRAAAAPACQQIPRRAGGLPIRPPQRSAGAVDKEECRAAGMLDADMGDEVGLGRMPDEASGCCRCRNACAISCKMTRPCQPWRRTSSSLRWSRVCAGAARRRVLSGFPHRRRRLDPPLWRPAQSPLAL